MASLSFSSFFRVLAFVLAVVSFSLVVSAQTSKPKPTKSKKATSGVSATVVTDGALVYLQPDFDSQVISQLPAGRKIVVSRGTVGDMAKFHRTRAGKKLGYIADVDVKLEDDGETKKASKSDAAKSGKESESRKKKAKREKEPTERLPIYFTKYVGAVIGMTEFREAITGVDAGEQVLIYGLKITGPDVLLAGPVMDLNLALHYGAPTYYNRLSLTPPKGFILLSDALFLLPLVGGDESMLYFGVGPLLMISQFNVVNSNRQMSLTTANLGASMALGGAIRFDKVALRLEGKYFYEKQSYKGIQASLQTSF